MIARTAEPKYGGEARTRLERYIRARRLRIREVEKTTGINRNVMLRYRRGEASPTLPTIRRILEGLRRLSGNPGLKTNDLFPLDDDDDAT